jgi:CheY-like chemotaxis protein
VEDNLATGAAMVDILQSQGYQIKSASDGTQALAIMAEDDPHIDLVLTDLVMPGMGGVDLARQLKMHYPHVKIVAMTGYPQTQEDIDLLDQGFHAWVQKPFEMETILAVLRRILESERM